MDKINRRNALKKLAQFAPSVFLAKSVLAGTSSTCQLTVSQTEGPFYPIEGIHFDNDLTRKIPNGPNATGEVLFLQGTVKDRSCSPLSNAIVEIWQANAHGKYDHPNDPSTAPLDNHFKYFGKANTNGAGEFLFKTIKPGAYNADINWIRPPHFHIKVKKSFQDLLTTQLYFAEDFALLQRDRILANLSPFERDQVVIEFNYQTKGKFAGHRLGNVNLVI